MLSFTNFFILNITSCLCVYEWIISYTVFFYSFLLRFYVSISHIAVCCYSTCKWERLGVVYNTGTIVWCYVWCCSCASYAGLYCNVTHFLCVAFFPRDIIPYKTPVPKMSPQADIVANPKYIINGMIDNPTHKAALFQYGLWSVFFCQLLNKINEHTTTWRLNSHYKESYRYH